MMTRLQPPARAASATMMPNRAGADDDAKIARRDPRLRRGLEADGESSTIAASTKDTACGSR
jgi:hypothetical protein